MQTIIAIMLIVATAQGIEINGFNYTDAEVSEMESGLSQYRYLAKNFDNLPANEIIPTLGLGLLKTSHGRIYVVGDRLNVHNEIQQALLAIPGHAEYYAEQFKIERAKAEATNAERFTNDLGTWWAGYDRFRSNAFETLGQLPSPETVRVLGEFLYDERDYQSEEFIRANRYAQREFGTTASGAAGALSRLPIDYQRGARANGKTRYLTIESWRLWYKQVKSGKRTFRFEGDPQEYDLNGPASKEALQTIERDRKRDEEHVAGNRKSSSSASEHSPDGDAAARTFSIATIIAGCGLLIAALWYLFRAGRRKA